MMRKFHSLSVTCFVLNKKNKIVVNNSKNHESKKLLVDSFSFFSSALFLLLSSKKKNLSPSSLLVSFFDFLWRIFFFLLFSQLVFMWIFLRFVQKIRVFCFFKVFSSSSPSFEFVVLLWIKDFLFSEIVAKFFESSRKQKSHSYFHSEEKNLQIIVVLLEYVYAKKEVPCTR